MLSLTSIARSAATQSRSRWRSSVALATVAAVPRRQNSSSAAPGSIYGDVPDMLNQAEEAEPPATDTRPKPELDYEHISNQLIKSSASLRGFYPNRFVKPYELSPKGRARTMRPHKRPLLGPGAKESRELDPFYKLNIDPLDECTNSSLMSEYVTEMGKIQPRAQTQLTWKNQRRLGKAIRRAKVMGIIPVLSRRPFDYSTPKIPGSPNHASR